MNITTPKERRKLKSYKHIKQWLEFWDTSGRDSPFNRAQISNRPPKGQKNSVFDSNLEVSIDGDTQNGWFTMESPIKMDDLGVPP